MEYYTVQEFANLLGVNRQTVYKWLYNGWVKYTQPARKASIRIPASELDRMRQQQKN